MTGGGLVLGGGLEGRDGLEGREGCGEGLGDGVGAISSSMSCGGVIEKGIMKKKNGKLKTKKGDNIFSLFSLTFLFFI